ncbi:MAG: hypothetical protein ACI9N9_002177 [Enterobacterales bacterium]|jgi:hypothetical protein
MSYSSLVIVKSGPVHTLLFFTKSTMSLQGGTMSLQGGTMSLQGGMMSLRGGMMSLRGGMMSLRAQRGNLLRY